MLAGKKIFTNILFGMFSGIIKIQYNCCCKMEKESSGNAMHSTVRAFLLCRMGGLYLRSMLPLGLHVGRGDKIVVAGAVKGGVKL